MKHKSAWRPIFSEPLHFKRLVVLPNHIFIAFNYHWQKIIMLSLTTIDLA